MKTFEQQQEECYLEFDKIAHQGIASMTSAAIMNLRSFIEALEDESIHARTVNDLRLHDSLDNILYATHYYNTITTSPATKRQSQAQLKALSIELREQREQDVKQQNK